MVTAHAVVDRGEGWIAVAVGARRVRALIEPRGDVTIVTVHVCAASALPQGSALAYNARCDRGALALIRDVYALRAFVPPGADVDATLTALAADALEIAARVGGNARPHAHAAEVAAHWCD